MKMTCSLLLLTICFVAQVGRANDAFHIYAPSRSTGKLLIIEATPTNGGLSLKLSKAVELGFPGATIVSHPDKSILYVAAPNGKEDDTAGAVVSLDRNGDNRFVYIPYVKDSNAIFQYRFDPESGHLAALVPKNANPPAGTGPRHMAYHPNKPIVYFSNEQHLGVSVYEMQESGNVKLRQVCDAVSKDEPKEGVSSSDIAITPDARFLFAGIRGYERDFDSISRYRVTTNGEVELLGLTPADKIPWGLTLSPCGRYLLATAFQGGTLTVFRIGDDGDLTNVASLSWDKNITDLVAR